MKDKNFDDCLKLYGFRIITDRLLEDHLITEAEARKLRRKIKSMEDALIADELPAKDCPRKVQSVEASSPEL